MTFDRTAHCRALSADPAIVARRAASIRIEWTPEMQAALVEMATARVGILPIARKIGVSKAVARARRDALGLPKGRAPGGSKSKRGTVTVRVL